ncbi:DUF979 domain-containing protein [Sphingomonas naphthae]|uniref:DUF979 domain-containing protein n=1 Tax=Sphingomonas naphthae TaxID=1813468 RepID=A0ABY7TP04_9SPHN|nr:DUF979 domain-containing protein [Sphingomonas naphthae]WCT74960.1 DUF979 domain-containing protein [Sphingomonas naphthae]
MITLAWLYALGGAMFAAYALFTLADARHPKRWGTAAFWGLLAASFLSGDRFGDLGNGILVLALVALAGLGLTGRSDPPTTSTTEREASAARRGNRLFLPALVIPATALLGTLLLKRLPLFEAKNITLISLGLGVLLALGAILLWLRPPARAPLDEGRRLTDAVGWAVVMPQMLAALGAVFALAGVGDVVGQAAAYAIPAEGTFVATAIFALGMAGFTIVMGNAFAAFPVMMAAVGLPVLVRLHGGDPAVVAAVGMLAGFCGTLLSPMAANFNIVPAVLLDLKDRHGVIRAQAGTALPLLLANILIIWWCAFP